MKALAGLQLIVFAGLIPALYRIDNNQIREPGRWFEPPGIGSLWGMWASISGGTWMGIIFAVTVFGCCVVLAVGYKRGRFGGSRVLVAWFSWGVGSIVVGWIVSHWVPIFVPRYLAFAGAGLALCVAGLLSSLLKSERFRGLGWIAMTAILVFSIGSARPSAPIVEDWQAAVEWIEDDRSEETKIIVSAGYQCRTLIYELNRDIFREYQAPHEVWFEQEGLVCVDFVDLEMLDRLNADQLILVQSHALDVDPENLSGKRLAVDYRKSESTTLPGINLSYYTRDSGRGDDLD